MGSLAKEIRQLLEENDVCEESEELDIDEIVGWAMEDDDCEEMDEGCGSKHNSDDDDEDDEDDDEMDEDVGICESRGYYTARTEADQDFADGWIAAMKNISSRDVEDVQSGMKKAIAGHSVDYGKGYVTAIGHWQGHAPKQLNRAHSIGLVKAYKGFHGQGSFAHPENSSVKGRKSEDVDGGSEELFESFKLQKSDIVVINAFLDKKSASSKRLSTDGKSLDIVGMGGRGVVVWGPKHIVFQDVGTRSAQTVQRMVKKIAPKNLWIDEDVDGGAEDLQEMMDPGERWEDMLRSISSDMSVLEGYSSVTMQRAGKKILATKINSIQKRFELMKGWLKAL